MTVILGLYNICLGYICIYNIEPRSERMLMGWNTMKILKLPRSSSSSFFYICSSIFSTIQFYICISINIFAFFFFLEGTQVGWCLWWGEIRVKVLVNKLGGIFWGILKFGDVCFENMKKLIDCVLWVDQFWDLNVF